jgi:tetratricopeptide (TPR) repeat protein
VYNLKRDSADGRIFIWNNCVQMVKEKPFFGSGYNSFIKAYNDQQITYFKNNPTDIENGYLAADARYAFNDYLEIAVESGIVGLSLFLLFILFVFKKNRFNKKSNSNVFLIGSKACVLSILVCGLFSYPLEVGQIYFLLFFFVAYIASANTSIFSVDGIASKSIVLVLVLFVSLSEFYVVRKFTAYIKWEKAFQYTYSENKQFSKASEIYKNIYPALKDDPLFLFNYGTTFSNFNEYEKSVSLLNEALRYKSSYDLYLNLGRAYEGIHADSLAEQTYIKVAFLVPHKFVPRYNLFKLYQRTNQERKAMEVAKTIKDMHIKVYSLVVGNIKSEAIKYLDTRNATLYTKCF